MKTKVLSFILLFVFLISCEKDDATNNGNILDPSIELNVDAGDDITDISDVQVTLNASALGDGEEGKWSIISGEIDDRVYFDKESDPKTVFYGLPDEEYELRWTVKKSGQEASDAVKVSFLPLIIEIENLSPDYYSTRLWLNVKTPSKGKWIISGDYQRIWNQNFGGTVIPDIESPHIKFYGFENTEYTLTWEVTYGNRSFSESISFTTGNYGQDEALEDLNVLNRPWRYKKNKEGNVVEVNMTGDGYGWRFRDMSLYPALQSLVYLKKLNLFGDGFYTFPNVIGDKYHDLEVLDFGGNAISSLPENIGNLQKLDTLIFEINQDNQKLTSLPSSFGNLKNLRYLRLSSMGVRYLPETFSNLSNLTYLNMSGNRIEKLPDNFGNLKKLEVYVGGGIDTDLPRSFSELKNLRWCSFWVYPENVSLPDDIGNLVNLTTLRAKGKYKSIPESFGNLTNLRELEFTGGSAISQIPESFGQLTNLQSLRMDVRLDNLPDSFERHYPDKCVN